MRVGLVQISSAISRFSALGSSPSITAGIIIIITIVVVVVVFVVIAAAAIVVFVAVVTVIIVAAIMAHPGRQPWPSTAIVVTPLPTGILP